MKDKSLDPSSPLSTAMDLNSDTSPNVVVTGVELFRIRKVPSSNLDLDTAYRCRFFVSFQANGGEFHSWPDG